MIQSSVQENGLQESKQLQNIKTIEQSLLILKHKLCQMNKKQSDNVKEIQKVFYSSIPNLKVKLSQTIECQKIQQKKKMLFNESVLKQRNKINLQRKMINQKQIQRNRQLISIMKINEHNSIKQMSKKNQLYIQKMKNFRLQQNKRKKQFIKGSMQNSRMKIQDFRTIKLDQIKKQKEEESIILQKKINRMAVEFGKLQNKQNQTVEKVDKSEQALRQLRFAVDRLQKMNENEFIRLKNKIRSQQADINEQKVIQKMLLLIIQASKGIIPMKGSRAIHNSRWTSQHMSKK